MIRRSSVAARPIEPGLFALVLLASLCTGCTRGLCPPGQGGESQLEQLAPQILSNTPERTHFAPGTRFSWVYLEPSIVAPPELAAEVERLMRSRYTVYTSAEEIPDHLLGRRDGEGRKHAGLVDGFHFHYEVSRLSSDRVRVEYRDYEGPLAASGRIATYQWCGKAWMLVSSEANWVS